MTDLPGMKVYSGDVVPEWIDLNGHMNVAYYLLAFDRAVDELWSRIGITQAYVNETRGSTFAVESHVTWQRELKEAEPFVITSQIIAYDEIRIHQFQRMYHAKEQYLAATAEWMNLHVDLNTRRVSPWPAKTLQELDAVTREQNDLPLPAEIGSQMRIKRPIYTAGGHNHA